MKLSKILLMSLLGYSATLSPAGAERLSASQVWFDSPGNKSAYERQITAYLAGEMLKAKNGYYDKPIYHSSSATYLNIGSYVQITDSTVADGATIYSHNCGSTTQQVTHSSDSGSTSSTQDTSCTSYVKTGGGYE